jgi:hypothetical protein
MLSIGEKSALVSKLADEMLESIDFASMERLAHEALLNDYDSMDEDDLLEFVNTYAPHLLEDSDIEYDGQPDELTEWHDFDPDC